MVSEHKRGEQEVAVNPVALRYELVRTPGVESEDVSSSEARFFDMGSLTPMGESDSEYADEKGESVSCRDSLYAVIGAGQGGDMVGVVLRKLEDGREGVLLFKYLGTQDFNDPSQSLGSYPVGTALWGWTATIGRGSHPEILDSDHTSRRQATVVFEDNPQTGPIGFSVMDGGEDKDSRSTNGTTVFYKPKKESEPL